MAGAIIEVKYFNTFILKKVNKTNRPVWNGSFGVPKDLGGYPVLSVATTGGPDTWAIEESRIRGGFNNTTVDFGAKAYIVEEEPKGTRRFNALIYSGIFNSRTGINQTNVFSVGEDITKATDPANGSIQKLYAEDTNLNIFQELKVSRALIDKDAIYAAEGGGTVTASNLVIGVIQPYAGKYGISRNPESFAVYGTRKYFADANNNAILRLSGSGIEEISAYGMKDYFRDNLNLVNNAWSQGKVIGAYDIYSNEYVVSLQDDGGNYYNTLSFDERAQGWVSFYSYEPDQMFSLRNNFYSVKTIGATGIATTTGNAAAPQPQSDFQLIPSTINGAIVPGSTVEGCIAVPCSTPGNFIELGTVSAFDSATSVVTILPPRTYTSDIKFFFGGTLGLYRHYSYDVNRGNFYGVDNDSNITFVFNPNVTSSKTFKTISYEGSNGWECSSFTSDSTGVTKAVDGSWITSNDTTAQINSYGEGEYVLVEATANASAPSTTTNVNLINRVGTIATGGQVSGDGVPIGTTVVSFNATSGDLVLSLPVNILINSVLFFSTYVSQTDYLTVFGTQNPGFDRLYSGFYRKENKYCANLINNSSATSAEVHFGDQMTGIKGFYSVVKLSTDSTTDYGGEKTLFSVSSEYIGNNGY